MALSGFSQSTGGGSIEMELTLDLLPGIARLLGEKAVEACLEEAELIAECAREKIRNPPKSGRIYYSKTKPSPHQASAPGEAPANWTGALVDSIHAEIVEGETAAIVRAGGAEAPYGSLYLEFGSPGGKIAPRPFFTPAVEEEAPKFPEIMRKAIDAAAREAVSTAVKRLG